MKLDAHCFQTARAALLVAALDATIFWGTLRVGVGWHHAHLAGFLAAVLLLFFFARLFRRMRPVAWVNSSLSLVDGVILCGVLFLRGGVLACLIDVGGMSPGNAGVFGAVFSAAALLGARAVWSPDNRGPAETRSAPYPLWRTGSILVYVILLRLLYSGSFELLHEEGYYWLFAQYLDIGYFDHPPMVGWLIWCVTGIFGHSEFTIRLAAFACWLIAAGYAARLTHLVGGKTAARRALTLMAVLPVFFATGMLMTPDAPLVACWAAVLFYLYRAVIDERPAAWLGVGMFMGLGLLSKYTMLLLGGAVGVFLLATPDGRRWLLRPGPYLAALLALALFSPVIVWNAANGWASFYFQAIGRHQGDFNFGLQDLIGSALVLLTPVGVLSLVAVARLRKRIFTGLTARNTRRGLRLMAYLTLVPLAVFFAFSLFRMSKLNWTAPIWLGALPYLALFTSPLPHGESRPPRRPLLFARMWPLTTAAVLVLYGGLLHYLVLGLPGLPYPKNTLEIGKQSLARQIHSAQRAFTDENGDKPLVVCWDSEKLASWLAYYLGQEERSALRGKRALAARSTTGAHLFGAESKMFRYWHPPEQFRDRSLLVVAKKRWELEFSPVLLKARPLGDVQVALTNHNQKPTGQYFYRFFAEGSYALADLGVPARHLGFAQK